MYKHLPNICKEKLINTNFGSIGHLKGSKLIDSKDKLLSEKEQYKYTICKRNKKDLVIITEKIDGMNAGVIKRNGLIYPINRNGYDSRTMGTVHKELQLLGIEWAKWVDSNYLKYNSILQEGERLVFENCIMQHTLKYEFKDEPVFLLAKYNSDNKKISFNELLSLARTYSIQQPPVLNIGVAISPEIIIQQYPKGIVGVKGEIEGIVYNYEHNGTHESCAKYVSNPIMGTIKPTATFYNSFNINQSKA